MTSAALRVVFYLRLSVAGDDESTAIIRQEADLRAEAERRGWRIVRTLIDDGFSGGKARAKADEALRMIREGEADVLAVWKFDRWSRQGVRAVADLTDVLEKRPSALFVALRDGWNSSSDSWSLTASVMAEVAKAERRNTSARVTSSIAHLRRTGRFAGGVVPYGYRTVKRAEGPGVGLVPVPEEVEILREIAARLIAGESPWRVCRDLNLRGIPAPRSEARRLARQGEDTTEAKRGEWKTPGLRTTMTSPHLLGRQRIGNDVLRDEVGLPVAVWTPLLDRATADALKSRFAAAATTPRRKRARLLSGLLTCGECGRALYVTSSRGAAAYRCMTKSSGGVCSSPTVSAPRAEEAVVAEVLRVIGDRPITETVSQDSPASLAARTALLDVETALADTSAALTADDADVSALLERIAALKAERFRLRDVAEAGSSLSVIVDTGRTWADDWQAAHRRDEEAAGRAAEADGVREEVTARQLLLSSVVERVALVGFTPDRRKFDPSRLVVEYVPDDITEAERVTA